MSPCLGGGKVQPAPHREGCRASWHQGAAPLSSCSPTPSRQCSSPARAAWLHTASQGSPQGVLLSPPACAPGAAAPEVPRGGEGAQVGGGATRAGAGMRKVLRASQCGGPRAVGLTQRPAWPGWVEGGEDRRGGGRLPRAGSECRFSSPPPRAPHPPRIGPLGGTAGPQGRGPKEGR